MWSSARSLLPVALVVALLAPAGRALGTSATGPTSFRDADGIHVVSATPVDDRQYDVRVRPAALGRPVDVRILLPAGYGADPTRRYPVLYLFHGTSGRASDWIRVGGAEAATARFPLITVMPDAGFDGDGGGWFTNWVNTRTALGPSQWESFHVDQLIPWVDANLRTVPDRDGRAVAGLSQGGFGSTAYAARHPDMFISAASFSGAPDIDYDPLVAAGATAIIEATAVGLDRVEPDAMFGSRATDEINWQGHDPADLVTNLRGVDVWLFTESGAPGPYDPSSPNFAAMGIEAMTHGSTVSFDQRARQLGVPVHLVDYGRGSHSWPYWARDLRDYLGSLMRTFAAPPAPPATVSYQSVDRTWTQWGWSVAVQRRDPQQFSGLIDGRAGGFVLEGSGAARVVAPPFYRRGSVATVTLSGPQGTSRRRVTVGSDGRLRLTVPLGLAEPPGSVGGTAVIGVPVTPPWGGATTVTIRAASPHIAFR
jgi:S-formylglutathione hydrolase FrmB